MFFANGDVGDGDADPKFIVLTPPAMRIPGTEVLYVGLMVMVTPFDVVNDRWVVVEE